MKNDTEKSRKLGYIPSTTSTTTIKELVTTGEGFIPIGLGESTNCLKGNFDEKNNFIDGIYINSNNGSTGGIIGLCLGNVVMENCYNKANIQTQGEVGGLIGVSVFNISMINCYNTGTIKGITIGGLLGKEASGDVLIEKSYNKGELIQEQKEGTSQKYMRYLWDINKLCILNKRNKCSSKWSSWKNRSRNERNNGLTKICRPNEPKSRRKQQQCKQHKMEEVEASKRSASIC